MKPTVLQYLCIYYPYLCSMSNIGDSTDYRPLPPPVLGGWRAAAVLGQRVVALTAAVPRTKAA